MAGRSAKTINKSDRERAVEAALALAAARGWENLSLPEIAKKAKIPLADFHELFEDRAALLAAWSRLIDQRLLQDNPEPDFSLSPRERLFDLLMQRLDLIGENREGAVNILQALKYDPKQALLSLPHLCRSMSWMLEASGMATQGMKGVMKIMGLTALYLQTLWVWCGDESADLSKTMAALDRNLDRAEQVAGTFGLAEESL